MAGVARGRHALRTLAGLLMVVIAMGVFLCRTPLERAWHSFRLDSSNEATSERAARSLLRLHSPRSVPRVIRAAHRHGYFQMHALELAETYAPAALERALPEAIEILGSESPFDCMAALRIVHGAGSRAGPAVPALLEAHETWKLSPDFGIHHEILEILAVIRPAPREAVPRLVAELDSYDGLAAELARQALKAIEPGHPALEEQP